MPSKANSVVASSKDTLLVLVRPTSRATGDRSVASKAVKAINDAAVEYMQISPELLERQVSQFLAKLQAVLGGVPDKIGQFSLEEIELAAELTAEGELAFLGTGVKLGGSGGLTFTFKRKSV